MCVRMTHLRAEPAVSHLIMDYQGLSKRGPRSVLSQTAAVLTGTTTGTTEVS